jgi:hypothetical protein
MSSGDFDRGKEVSVPVSLVEWRCERAVGGSLCKKVHPRGVYFIPAAYVIRQHTSAYLSYVSIPQHTSAYVSKRQHTSANVSKRQHTSAYVSIRQHTCDATRV